MAKIYSGYIYPNPSALNDKCHCCKENIPFACVTTIDGETSVMENLCRECLDSYYPEEVWDAIN